LGQTAKAEPVENSGLNAELLYEILVGELELRNEDWNSGFALLLDAARKSNDYELYSRSVEVALQARSGDGALVAARAWAQSYPQDRKANMQVLQILLALNQTNETLDPLKKELSLAPANERADAIALIPRYFSREKDKPTVQKIVTQALEPYLNAPDTAGVAWTTVGRMRLLNNDLNGALEAARKGTQLDPKSIQPGLLALELMPHQVEGAEALVKQSLKNQKSAEFALSYVRILIELNRYQGAAEQLGEITRAYPLQAEAWLVLGSLQYEQNQDKAAETSLAQYVKLVSQKSGASITKGLQQAQARRASILARQGNLKAGLKLLDTLPANSNEDKQNILTAKVQLLRDERQWQAAFDLLSQANITDIDLIYEQAMLAERLNKMDDMERLLRQIMTRQPDYYNAYNALGFSWADRGMRLPEAKEMIAKALSFAPEDPFIIDSLGWVEFRLGELDNALQNLQKAYSDRADPEIGAHLGEVLWQMNRQDEARKVWHDALEQAPSNETLLNTLKRIKPEL
jgi:tetratricopeptide (TPR) repeat protein